MKLAYVHQLPLEIYPPATNALAIFARQNGWEVRAWSIANRKGLPAYTGDGVEVRRLDYPGPQDGSGKRLPGFLRWHFAVARDLARWRPDTVLAVEPHSALAVWMYYRLFGGSARLLIHHHEYYAPVDFLGPGSRTSRLCHSFEKSDLFGRACWVSETNETRLRLLQADCPAVTGNKGRLWPNYPPADWVNRVAADRRTRSPDPAGAPLRLVCVGSLSFEDTFIREAVEWVAARPGQVALHVCGHNVKPEVWQWIKSLGRPNITIQPDGCGYDELPEFLVHFDVSLVLYKGNTLNFIHNVPNKAIEALVCGLEVWYPPAMAGMACFHRRFPDLPLREVNFRKMMEFFPAPMKPSGFDCAEFSAENAIRPLLESLHQLHPA